MNEASRGLLSIRTSDRVKRKLGRVRFMAHLEKVRRLLQNGYSLIGAYDELQPRLDMSYSQFTRYVAQFVRQLEKPDVTEEAGVAKNADDPTGSSTTAVMVAVKVEVKNASEPTKPRRTGFTYDNSTPKDKLV
jgi:hypothetical protein